MEYNFAKDIQSIREILGLSQEELSNAVELDQEIVSAIEANRGEPSIKSVEKIYSYAFSKDIKLNKLKEMLAKDDLNHNEKLLFHGSKNEIDGKIDIHHGRSNNDFGQGFYAGESYEQAVSYVSNYNESSVYFLKFNDSNFKCKRYAVDQEWMMTIACYRGTLDAYANHPIIQKLMNESRNCDYIVAPIADNRMFKIINSFINGEITDEQCKHCLSATNLGMQYIFTSEEAISKVEIIERCYISDREKEYYRNIREAEIKLGDDKVKLARKEYRGKGLYIDEILR